MEPETFPLTKYDDYPVHQAPYPFSYTPVTDYGWDEGYMFGALNPKTGCYLLTGCARMGWSGAAFSDRSQKGSFA